MGLEPILDTLDLDDGNVVIGEEGLEGMLLGMATPMSDIPVCILSSNHPQTGSDVTLHRLTDEGAEALIAYFLLVLS
mgnify:CR=1 FL=1